MRSALKTLMTATAATALMAGAVAHAADPVEIDISGEASVVAGVSDGDAKADADAIVKVKGSTVLNNGTEVGAVVERTGPAVVLTGL